MADYLLIKTLMYGLTTRRLGASFPGQLSFGSPMIREIVDILKENDRTIVDRYYDIDYVLQTCGSEIWLMFDEFQQVVENWNRIESEEPSEFIDVCDCINEASISRIKLIFCGSDELLRQMVLVENNSVWRKKIFEQQSVCV